MRVYQRLRRHMAGPQSPAADFLLHAFGPAALADAVAITLFIGMMFVWFVVIGGE